MNSDYYDILGVEKTASKDEIKRAFRKKAAQLHPDKNKDPKAPEQFKKINEAYQVLSDEKKRQMYDHYGQSAVDGNGGGFNPFGGGGQGFEVDFSDLFGGGGFGSMFGEDNIFGDLFGRRGGQQKRNSGDDINLRVSITLEEIIKGPEKEISFKKKESCKACKGLGGSEVTTCQTCKGSGRVAQISRSILGNIQVMRECVECNGTGKKIQNKCNVCNGNSIVEITKNFKFKIPQGIDNGMSLRFQREGDAGKFNSPAGDLFIQMDVKKDKRFVRKEDNLIMQIPLPIYSLVLGDQIQISTFDGEKTVKIPKGLEVGEKLKLRGLGIPNIRTKNRGDIILDIKVEIPQKLSKEEEKLFENLKNINKNKSKSFWKF